MLAGIRVSYLEQEHIWPVPAREEKAIMGAVTFVGSLGVGVLIPRHVRGSMNP
jgi:hypothetical protein